MSKSEMKQAKFLFDTKVKTFKNLKDLYPREYWKHKNNKFNKEAA